MEKQPEQYKPSEEEVEKINEVIVDDEKKEKENLSYIEINNIYSREEIADLHYKYSEIKTETFEEEGKKRAPQFLAENQEYQDLLKEYQEKGRIEKESALKQIHEAVQKSWDGEFGQGRWVLVSEKKYTVNKFRKVIPLSEWRNKEIDKKEENKDVFALESYYLLNPSNIEKAIEERGVSNAKDFDNRFLEVNISQILDEEKLYDEYQQLFEKHAIERKSFPLNTILNALPEDFVPIVKEGTIFQYGSCSHHSGEIDGYLVTLPTGNFAVVSEHSGENEDLFGKYEYYGILKDPKTEPHWSVKEGGWSGDDLDQPSKEEVEFLKGLVKKSKNPIVIKDLPLLTSLESISSEKITDHKLDNKT
jgi:hypothetical protein